MTIFGAQDYLVGLQTGFRYLTGESKIIVNDYKIWKSESSNNSVRLEDIIKPITVICQMLTNNTSVCMNTETTSDAIINFLSIPVIGVLMRFSPLISLVDEYAFYIYHRAKYDRGFRFIVSLCAEWTDGKWVPSFLEKLSEWLNVVSKAVAETSIDGQTVSEPNKFEEFGKSNNFYKNISIFLVISLPANLIAFGLLAIIARILEKFQILRWLRLILRPFRSFLNLWSSVLFDNMTYLSFHCFLQLSNFVPYSHGANSFPSCLFCLLILFAILMTCFLGVPIKLFAKNLFEVDYCN
jgi:hypothetical protein